MVDGGFLMTLTDLLQNEAVRETVGKYSEKIVDLTHKPKAYIEQEVQARKNIFACRCKRQQNCTTPILTSPSTSSSTWPGVFLSLNKKNMRIAAVAEKVDGVKLSLTCFHQKVPSLVFPFF